MRRRNRNPNLGVATTIPEENFIYEYDWNSDFIGRVRVPKKSGTGRGDLLEVKIGIYQNDWDEEGYEYQGEWVGIDSVWIEDYIDFHFDSPANRNQQISSLWENISIDVADAVVIDDKYLLIFEDEDEIPFRLKDFKYISFQELADEFDFELYISDAEIWGQQVDIEDVGSSYALVGEIPDEVECRNGEMAHDPFDGRGYAILEDVNFELVNIAQNVATYKYSSASGYPVIHEILANCPVFYDSKGGEGETRWEIVFSVNKSMKTGEGDNPFGVISAVEHILEKALEKANDDDELPYKIQFTAVGGAGGGRDKVYKIFARKIAREWDYDITRDSGDFVLTKKEIGK